MIARPFSFAVGVTLATLLLLPAAFPQSAGDGLSTADPAQEGFSTRRLDEMQKAIQAGDFKAITSMVIAPDQLRCEMADDHFDDRDRPAGNRSPDGDRPPRLERR